MDAPSDPRRLQDPRRLDAVRRSGLLDTPPEEPFDRLARLASLTLETPLAFVTVVDDARCFWKASVGAGPGEGPIAESFCRHVVAADAEFVVGDVATDPRTHDDPAAARLRIAAWAGFPLRDSAGEVLGSLCVADHVPREWRPRDLEILRTLAEAASGEVALRESAARNAALARSLQETLLPPVAPQVPGMDVGAAFRASGEGTDLTGDFYDVFESTDRKCNAVLGDVSGKGIEAARMTGLARYTLRAGAMRDSTPSHVLALLDDAIKLAPDTGDRFVTAVLATLEPTADGFEGTVSCGGHPPAILRTAAGEVHELEAAGGVLGVLEPLHLSDRLFHLAPGDALVLYTDGATDTADAGGARFGAERLQATVRASDGDAQALADAVLAAVVAHGGEALTDDVAVVVLRVPA